MVIIKLMELSTFKKSSLFIGTGVSAVMLLAQLHVRGMWSLSGLAAALWLFWLGVAVSRLIRLPKGLIIAFMVCGLVMVAYLGTPYHDEIIGRDWSWMMLGFSVLGLAVPKDYEQEERKFSELLGLSLLFILLTAACCIIGERAKCILYVDGISELTGYIWTGLKIVRYVAIVCAVYYIAKLAGHKTTVAIMSNNIVKWACIVVCILTLAVLILCGRWQLWMKVILCPATAGILALIGCKILCKSTK